MATKVTDLTAVSQSFINSDYLLVSKHVTQTSGVLIVGEKYTILDFNAGDDFANVATVVSGTINTTGCVFTATGTTPTTYTNGSTLAYYVSQKASLAQIGGMPKIYKALLTQTGTDAPVATVLENTLGEVPTFSYLGSGAYQVTSPGGIFVQAKTVLYPITSIDVDFSHSFIWNSTTQLYINTAMLGVKSNDLLNYTLILIEVYP